MRLRKSTFSFDFLVHPVTKNRNTSEQTVTRVENMNTQGTAKILRLARIVDNRWDEKAGLRRDAVRSQIIGVLRGTRDKGDRPSHPIWFQ